MIKPTILVEKEAVRSFYISVCCVIRCIEMTLISSSVVGNVQSQTRGVIPFLA